eukprot:g13367.t1
MLWDLFRERDCVTIVRPVAEEADLRNIQQVPYEKLRPQFRTQVEAFVKKVYTYLKPKKIDGNVVTGRMFVDLASEYCKAINGSAVPTIHAAWASVVQHQFRLALRDAVQVYRQRMNERAMQHLPMAEEKLRDLHKIAKAEALKTLFATKLEHDPRFRECRSQFAARVKQLLEHVRTENANSSARVCDKLAKELFKQMEQKTYQGFNDLLLDSRLMPVRRLLKQQLAESEARILQLKAPEDAQRQLLTERLDFERRLDEARRSAEAAAQKAAREKAQLLDAERTLKEQMKIMQESTIC